MFYQLDQMDITVDDTCSAKCPQFAEFLHYKFEVRRLVYRQGRFRRAGNGGEVDWEEQIIKDESFKGTKAECVYEKLLNSSTGFKKMIQKFDGDFPVSHLRFINDPSMASNTRKAYATPPSNYVIDITINGNSSKDASYQKRPNLLVAKTIIHEVIHAEIFRKLLSLSNNNGSINAITLSNMLQNGDYPGILDYYARFGANDFQHQQIAAYYREVIVEGLKEFDNSSNADQLYEDLA